ncbi:MAG: ABC transporter permease [Candidatus Promineifilaceae bacterium]
MKIIDLLLKDLLQTVRDWRAALFLVIMPVGFTIMFGFAFGGFGNGEPADSRLPVGLLDQDQGSLSPILLALLENSKVVKVEVIDVTVDESGEMVSDNELAAVLIIPPGYSERFLEGNAGQVTVITDPGTNAGLTVQGEVQAAAVRLNSAVRTAIISNELFDRESGFVDPSEHQEQFDNALAMTISAWDDPPIGVTSSSSTSITDDEEEAVLENAFSQSSPGMMAQFAIAGLMGASAILVLERKNRTMRRLLTTALTRVEILLGHYLAMFVMIFVQLMILILFGQLLLRLNYLDHPAATLLMAVATALFAASLGLLIGALAKSEEQVIVFAMIPMFVLSALGGAWVPMELTPEGFQQVARLTPLAFVMDGFQDIIIRDLGLEALVLNIVILLAYALVFFAIGAWRFRYE